MRGQCLRQKETGCRCGVPPSKALLKGRHPAFGESQEKTVRRGKGTAAPDFRCWLQGSAFLYTVALARCARPLRNRKSANGMPQTIASFPLPEPVSFGTMPPFIRQNLLKCFYHFLPRTSARRSASKNNPCPVTARQGLFVRIFMPLHLAGLSWPVPGSCQGRKSSAALPTKRTADPVLPAACSCR